MGDDSNTGGGKIVDEPIRLTFGQVRHNGKHLSRPRTIDRATQVGLFAGSETQGRAVNRQGKRVLLPKEDNTPEGLQMLLAANARYRESLWPAPYDRTAHRLHLGDARNLGWIPDTSVHLIVTSPPYWTLKKYEKNQEQMGHIADYEQFLDELDKVWRECARVLVGGGRICCIVGDVCIPRKKGGRHHLVPLHADIQVRVRRLGLDCLMPILWHKIANGATEVEGNGAGFYGKPYQPGGIIKNDIEYILFLRKGGEYRSVSMLQKALSMLNRDEMRAWQRSIWTDLPGASTRDGHPAPYPVELAERLIRLFSFAGDTILDPFAGTGSTSLAAIISGRHSISNEIEPAYIQIAQARLLGIVSRFASSGPALAEVMVDATGATNRVSPARSVQTPL
jgi:site-specific DNA-methyltransferase (adenine-specific)